MLIHFHLVLLLKNTSDDGSVDTLIGPTILLACNTLGGLAGDEDPLPPYGANPHPMPFVHNGFWHDTLCWGLVQITKNSYLRNPELAKIYLGVML
jgi:hypothetical protein